MTKTEKRISQIKFELWTLRQSNLHRSEIYDRSNDEEHKKNIADNMAKTDKEIARLRQELRELSLNVPVCVETNHNCEKKTNIVRVLSEEENGLNGYIEDVTNEDWYKNPPITLYDQLEYDTYELLCKYSELIGVHLDKEDIGDFRIVKEIQDLILAALEKEFGIPFPTTTNSNSTK